jgi:hypothetical protein
MRRINFRTIVATVAAAIVCLVTTPRPSATDAERPFQRFVARAPFDGDPGSGPSAIDIVIERWSTSKDRSDLHSALTQHGPEGLLPGLHMLKRRAGVLLIPGVPNAGARALTRRSLNLSFADELQTSTGRQIIVAADHYLAFGQPTVQWPSDYEFSLLDIRIAADGAGIGKVVPADKVAYNEKTKMIEAADYDTLPVRLIGVRAAEL